MAERTPMVDLAKLSFDAKAVAGGWFGIMIPGKSELTFQLNDLKPTARAQAALNEMVVLGVLSVEPFNDLGGLVYRPLVHMDAAYDWLHSQLSNPDIKFPITEKVAGAAEAAAHQKAALDAAGREPKNAAQRAAGPQGRTAAARRRAQPSGADAPRPAPEGENK